MCFYAMNLYTLDRLKCRSVFPGSSGLFENFLCRSLLLFLCDTVETLFSDNRFRETRPGFSCQAIPTVTLGKAFLVPVLVLGIIIEWPKVSAYICCHTEISKKG